MIWSDAGLEDSPAHRERLARAVADIRVVETRFPDRAPPRPRGAAFLLDEDGVAASWLRDALLDGATWPRRFPSHQRRHGSRERGVAAWLRGFEERGVLPGVVTLEELGPETTARFPLLVVPGTSLLDEADLDLLTAHLERSGSLRWLGPIWRDRRGEPLDDDRVAELDRIGSDRHTFVDTAGLDSEREQASIARVLDDLVERAGLDLHAAPGSLAARPGLPLLRVCHELPGDARLLVVLPRLETTAERTERLEDVELTVAPPRGMDSLLDPPGRRRGASATLRAGDAAVLLLER